MNTHIVDVGLWMEVIDTGLYYALESINERNLHHIIIIYNLCLHVI